MENENENLRVQVMWLQAQTKMLWAVLRREGVIESRKEVMKNE